MCFSNSSSVTDFKYAHEPHCYTQFYLLQPLTLTSPNTPGTVISELMSSRSQLSLSSLYLRLLTSSNQTPDDISIVMTIATYSIYCF